MSDLGIDIGGTKINFVLLNGKKIVRSWKVLTPESRRELIETLKNNIPQGVRKIGIGVPGPLNKKGDLILNPPNLKALHNCPLAGIIEKETGVKTAMDNDANCFALGEAILGAGRGANIIFGVTLGTGVGGGIAIEGKVFKGAFGAAGEIGHTTIKFDGPKCHCGISGCFEGNWGSQNFFKKRGGSPFHFREMAEKGDKKALNLYKEYGRHLGIGLSNVVNLLDPEIIVIGGGISNSYKFFIKELEKELKKRIISPDSRKYVKIKKAALDVWAGAVGAALLNN